MYETSLVKGSISIGNLIRLPSGSYCLYEIKNAEDKNKFQRQVHASAARIHSKVNCQTIYAYSAEGVAILFVKVTIS